MTATVSMFFNGRDGNRIAADRAGNLAGPPVVLLHGGGQTRHSWGTTLRALGAAGWDAYSIDLRGHGDSDWVDDGAYDLDAFAGDIAAVASTFDTPPVLVGASLGGLSSMAAIGEAPDGARVASALVLVDVAPRMEETGRLRISAFMQDKAAAGFASLDEVADAIQAYNPHRSRPTDLNGLRKNLRQRDDGRWYWHWDPRFVTRPTTPGSRPSNLVDADRLGGAARRVSIPTLLVRGRMSDLLSEEGAKEFQALVPHAEYVDIAGAGHMVAGDRNDVFNDAVVEFLNRVRLEQRITP